MKKFLKFVLTAAGVCAGVAGGLFLYNKIKEKQCGADDDFNDDFDYDDDFADDEDESSYVDITPAAEASSDVSEDGDAADEE